MARFIYFLPIDRGAPDPADFVAAGLAYALNGDKGGPTGTQTTKGPGNVSGILCAVNGPGDPPPMYHPDRQTWRQGPGAKFWIGLDNDAKPGPDDLARPRIISGEHVKLRDGNEWTVPICFSFLRGMTLPRTLVLGEDCQTWKLATLPEFLKLCKDAEMVWEAYRNPDANGEITIGEMQAPRIAVDALAVNYRIGALEVSMLGLLSNVEMWDILEAMIDKPNLERVAMDYAKKNATPAT